MKNVALIEEALRNDHAIRAVPELIVDWNMNRYVGAVADNTPSDDLEGYDIELFPIESIIESNRPTKGINKARIGSSIVGNEYKASGSGDSTGRFYVADVDDSYKYWTSPKPSDGSGNLPVFNATNFPTPEDETYTHDSITSVRPRVVYDENVSVNKIVVTTENTWATAKTFKIQVATVPSPSEAQWTTIADQTTLGNSWKPSGQIVLWYNGNGTALTPWVSTGRVDKANKEPKKVQIRAVRMVVTALEGGYQSTPDNSLVPTTYSTPAGSSYVTANTNGTESFFDLIEISARLEVDLSKYIISLDDTFDFSDASTLYPLGTVTSNQATVTLSNLYQDSSGDWTSGIFSAENMDSPYRNFIDANAEMNLKYRYFDEDDNFLGEVQQFKMYVDDWTGQSDESVAVNLRDYSKFFNSADVKLRPALWEDLTVPEIVWRLLDSVGFVDYEIDYDADRVTEHTIPIFYVDGESTVWEVLSELSEASQTAIYFDGNGKLQVKTRDFAFSKDDAPVWSFTSEETPEQLPNIANLEMNTDFEPNHFKVIYQKTNWSAVKRQQPSMQEVWGPEEESVTLRGTPLVRDLELDSVYFWIGADDVRFWPYEGLVNIDGELIRYKGKHFVYYTGANGNTRNTMVIESEDDYKARNAQTKMGFKHKNHFTGGLKIVERGVWNSEPKRHNVEIEGYSVHQIVNGNRTVLSKGGLWHRKQESRAQLASGANFKNRKDFRIATRGAPDDQPFFNYGTRFRLLKQQGRVHQAAGLVIHNYGSSEDGYYFEFMPTNKIPKKSNRQEFLFYSRKNGVQKILGQRSCNIVENIDYEFDLEYRRDASKHYIRGFLNGKMILDATVATDDRVEQNGRFGMFLRGKTLVEYEYLYAIRREEEPKLLEDFSFLDKVERGYRGGQWDREWTYRWKDYKRRVKKKWKKNKRRKNRQFFDEFGPIVHEVREFDVKFEPSPVLHSRLYLTNDWSATPLEYVSSPFDAKFIIANTSRKNAVVHGEDTISFVGSGDSINQVLSVYGRAMVVEEGEEVIAENTDQIRRRGKTESELSSPWIQSKRMAKDVAEWLRNTFSYGNNNITIEAFGNPLIEVGDVVNVNYPLKHINGDFFVVGVSNTYENGIITSLDLRRRISS